MIINENKPDTLVKTIIGTRIEFSKFNKNNIKMPNTYLQGKTIQLNIPFFLISYNPFKYVHEEMNVI